MVKYPGQEALYGKALEKALNALLLETVIYCQLG